MKNKKIWIISSTIVIVLMIVIILGLKSASNNIKSEENIKLNDDINLDDIKLIENIKSGDDKKLIEDINLNEYIKLNKEWNLSYGNEITSDMYENKNMNFLENDGDNSFVSIDKNNESYVLVGTTGRFHDQGIIECYDFNGKIRWSKKYSNIDSKKWDVTSEFKDVLSVEDGYVVIGYETGEGPKFSDEYQNAIILKYGLNGDLVWNKKYNSLISTEHLNNNLSYNLIDIINIDEKYYIVGNLNEYKVTKETYEESGKYGFVLELDSKGNEISFNKYTKGSEFYSSKVIENKIVINSLLKYEVDAEYTSYKKLGLLTFEGNKYSKIINYLTDEYQVFPDNYTKFEYLNGTYYLLDTTRSVKILVVDENSNEKFNMQFDEGDKLDNYWFQDITTDGEYIYIYAYYYDMTMSSKMTDSAIIIIDKDGKYSINDIDEQYYYKILFKDKSLLLAGSENSFAKYNINK